MPPAGWIETILYDIRAALILLLLACFFGVGNRTDLELAGWLGSHLAAVALQAALGIAVSLGLAYLSYELFEKRFLRLKRLFETRRAPAPKRPAVIGD